MLWFKSITQSFCDLSHLTLCCITGGNIIPSLLLIMNWNKDFEPILVWFYIWSSTNTNAKVEIKTTVYIHSKCSIYKITKSIKACKFLSYYVYKRRCVPTNAVILWLNWLNPSYCAFLRNCTKISLLEGRVIS